MSGAAFPKYNAGLRWWKPIQGTENQIRLFGGMIKPAGTGAPATASAGASFWTVSRSGVGTFLVTFVGNPGAGTSRPATTIAKLQCIFPTLQIDSAGADLTLTATITNVTGSTFTIVVTDTTTGAAHDIVQPGSPNAQGSFIHWLALTSNDNTQGQLNK
jgi:hypothetical protein